MPPAPDPLRILVTGAADSPHESERALAFAALGHDVAMLSPTEAVLPGIPVHVPRPGRSGLAPLRRLTTLWRTVGLLRQLRRPITHCHYAAEYATWAAALLGLKPLVITVMGGDVLFDEQGRHGVLSRALTRFALRRADLVTVKSPHLGTVVRGFGVPPERVMTVLWGIDIDAFRPDAEEMRVLRDGWALPPGRRVLLSPRPLKPLYNQTLMLEALAILVGQGHDLALVCSLYGAEPEYRAALVARATALGVAERLVFAEPRSHARMADLYGLGDIVLSLPPSDGFPQTLIEAAATGKPTVMTATDRFEGLLTDGRHMVFTPLEATALAARVARLIQEPELVETIRVESLTFARAHADLPAAASAVAERMRALPGAVGPIASTR